jgi:hypothetical protein
MTIQDTSLSSSNCQNNSEKNKEPSFWGFGELEISLTNDANQAFVLNFLASLIKSNAFQNVCKHNDKFTVYLAYSRFSTRFPWMSEKTLRIILGHLIDKKIVETLEVKNGCPYKIYTLTDEIYCKFNILDKKQRRGGARNGRGGARNGRGGARSDTINNSSNNSLTKNTLSTPAEEILSKFSLSIAAIKKERAVFLKLLKQGKEEGPLIEALESLLVLGALDGAKCDRPATYLSYGTLDKVLARARGEAKPKKAANSPSIYSTPAAPKHTFEQPDFVGQLKFKGLK